MPAEALENIMLDTLEAELLKIGTAPTSDWLTNPTPAVKVGVPDANVPAPNLMTIYLQHVRTERGDDAAGVADHKIRSTFALWCVSSHPADGHRRMLNLYADVRRCLLAAERTFFEVFKYGITLLGFDFDGSRATIDQGLSAGVYQVVIEADVEHPPSSAMTTEQVQALITEELMSMRYQRITHLAPASNMPSGLSTGIRSTGYAEVVRGFTREVGLPSGSNRMFELFTNPIVVPIPVHTTAGFDLRCMINSSTQVASATGECFVGIQMGSFKCLPPFQTNYAAVSLADEPVFQFRYNYTLARFELLVWDQDQGSAPEIVATTVPHVFGPDNYIKEFRMLYEPAPAGGSSLKCYLNGELVHTCTSARLQNCYGSASQSGPGIILCGGTTSGTFANDAHFFDVYCVYPGFRGIVPPNPP